VLLHSMISGTCCGQPNAAPALAETLYCTTSFQGYRVCDDGHGYSSIEWSRDGMRFGQDSDGNRWTTSRWRDTNHHRSHAAPGALTFAQQPVVRCALGGPTVV
jgi:hypothetical protein